MRISQMASSRIVRWAIILSAYTYTIRYKPGKHLSNADALSRLPSPSTTSFDCVPANVSAVIHHLSSSSIDASDVKELTAKDLTLSCSPVCVVRMANSKAGPRVSAIRFSQERTQRTRWLCSMVFPYRHSTQRPTTLARGAAQHSPGCQQNEGISQVIHLVARHGWRHQKRSQILCSLPRISTSSCHCSVALMGMAI